MHQMLLFVHLVAGAVWLGCVLTEALFERALLAGDRAAHRVLAELHVRVDGFIELPAIALVLATGLALARQSAAGAAGFGVMPWAGAGAMVLNLFCVGLVFARRSAAVSQAWARFDRLDRLQHQAGAGVLLLLLVALAAGAWGRLAG